MAAPTPARAELALRAAPAGTTEAEAAPTGGAGGTGTGGTTATGGAPDAGGAGGAGGQSDGGLDASVPDSSMSDSSAPDSSVPDASTRCVPVQAATRWGTARVVSDDVNDAQAPRVAIDPQGNVAVIWNQLEAAGSQFDVGAALRTAAGDWSSPGFAESDNAYFGWAYSSGGGVGALGGGAFVGTWRVFPGSPAISGYAFINRYTPGSGWGAPVIPLDEDRGTTLFEPQIVANGAGAGIATWFEVGAINRTDIVASLLVGEPAAPAVVVSRGAAAAIEYHAAAMNASGDAVVVWAEVGATRRDVWVRRLAGGTWQTPTLVNTSTVGDADTPHVAINDAGDVVVVWWQPGANGASATWARTFTVAGGWGSAAEIGPNLVNNTRVALDAAGNAIATWEAGGDTLRGNYSIRAARYEKGVGWGAPVILSAPDDEGGNALNPDLAMDAAGNAVVVWPTGQYPQSAASIWANRYHAGIGWDCPHVIETDPQPTDRPRVAMNGTGRAVVAWQRQDVADGSDGLHDAWANVLE